MLPNSFKINSNNYDNTSVIWGTTCFLRETTPDKKAIPSSNWTLNASPTLSFSAPTTKILESLLIISVTTSTNKSYFRLRLSLTLLFLIHLYG